MTKKYQDSHPWLTFTLPQQRFPGELYFDLGECVSKCDHLQRTAMSAELRQDIYTFYFSKGAQATTAIEGNTLDEKMIEEMVAGKSPKTEESYQNSQTEVANVITLYNQIMSGAQNASLPPLTPDLLNRFQAQILKNLPHDGNIGKPRQRGVVVNGYRGTPSEECAALLQRLCSWLADDPSFIQLEEEYGKKAAGIIRAILVHLYIAWIHPYDDGNGRCARMAEFYCLVAAGISGAAAHLLSNHCHRVRNDYYQQLANASEQCNPMAFIRFMVKGLRDGLRKQLQHVYQEHERLVWRDTIERKITGTTARERRIALARQLQAKEEVQSAAQLLADPAIAMLYADKKSSVMLLNQDLAALQSLAIIKKEGGYLANTQLLYSMKLPVGK